MATRKDIKRIFRRYVAVMTIIIAKGTASGPQILLRYITENQILFCNIGLLVTKLTYLNIRYVVNFFIPIANKCKEEEMKRKRYQMDFSQLTSEEKDNVSSIWIANEHCMLYESKLAMVPLSVESLKKSLVTERKNLRTSHLPCLLDKKNSPSA